MNERLEIPLDPELAEDFREPEIVVDSADSSNGDPEQDPSSPTRRPNFKKHSLAVKNVNAFLSKSKFLSLELFNKTLKFTSSGKGKSGSRERGKKVKEGKQ